IAVIVCLAAFFLMPEPEKNNPTESENNTTVSSQNNDATVTQQNNTTSQPGATDNTVPSGDASADQTPEQTPVQTPEQNVPVDETAEILKVVSDSVNLLKSDKANFTGHKVQSIDMKLVDSSVPSMNGVANKIIGLFIKDEVYDYDFTNGVSSDPEEGGTIRSIDAFPPGDKPFELTREGVASATKTMSGENTVYTVVIVRETSTLENPRPPHHNAGADTLDLSDVDIPIVTINRVDFDYPGAEISVTISPDGKIVGYHEHLKMSGTGEVSGLGMTGYGTIEGYIDEKWDVQWK
ncbi:MAG: hypothetical protein IKY78_05025, partial [Clostridia bacterium]|nr:hypothetical protein [Clostridia bacterium]